MRTPRVPRPAAGQSNQGSSPCSGKTACRVAMTARSTASPGRARSPGAVKAGVSAVGQPGRRRAARPAPRRTRASPRAPRPSARRGGAPRSRPGGPRPGARRPRPRSRRRRAATQRPCADLVRQVVQRGRTRPLAVQRQRQVGQRVERVGVAAVLGDQDVRGEGAHQRRHDGVERPQPRGVAGAGREGDVDGAPSAPGPPTSAGKPVPGKSIRPVSCSEMVRTRGSSQKIRWTPSPWWTSTST